MSDLSKATECGCGHLVSDHAPDGPCKEWRRYPEVLDPRPCGCLGVWQRPTGETKA